MPMPTEFAGVPMRRLEVFRLHPDAMLPTKAHISDVGWDLYALSVSETGRPLTRPLHRGVTAVPTGLVVRPPSGFYLQVCSRSGLARDGIFVANAPGIIDPTYVGEIVILLFNGSHETKYVQHGNRIAQLVVAPIVTASVVELKTRPAPTERGEAGFGSTGA